MTRALVLALALMTACTDEPGTSDEAPLGVAEGEPCNWPAASCEDAASLLWCDAYLWTIETCDDYCAALGPGVHASGCNLEIGDGAPEQLCGCEPPADGCYPGQGRCESDDEIGWCADTWTWTTSSCTSICATQSLLSLGCDAIGDAATCICTNIGTACTDEPSVCSSSTTISTCEAGTWAQIDCLDVCGPEGRCEPDADGSAACNCA